MGTKRRPSQGVAFLLYYIGKNPVLTYEMAGNLRFIGRSCRYGFVYFVCHYVGVGNGRLWKYPAVYYRP